MQVKGRQAKRTRRVNGFTLIEVVMGLALITLLFGGIYGIANASIDLGKNVSDNRLRELRASGLINLFRDGLGSLPPGSKLELPSDLASENSNTAITIIDAPGLWSWSSSTDSADSASIRIEAAPSGGIDLMLDHARKPIGTQPTDTESDSSQWTTFASAKLISLDSFSLEFFDPRSESWTQEWPASSTARPKLVALNFKIPGDPQPRRQIIKVAPATSENAQNNTAPTGTEGSAGEGGNG